jgi:hypothetical protein
MHFQFVKKLQFTKLLKAQGRLREFNFLKHSVEPADYFSVDTVDDRGNRISFKMFDVEGAWKIEEKNGLPIWVLETEQQLHKLIAEEMQ